MYNTDAFIFDWGNTLVDYPLQSVDQQLFLLRVFLSEKLKDPSFKYLKKSKLNKQSDILLRKFNDESEDYRVLPFRQRIESLLNTSLPNKMAYNLEEALCNKMFKSSHMFDDALFIFRRLKAMQYKIGIISNAPWGTNPRLWREEIRRYGFDERVCNTIVICGDVGYRKPHSKIFERCFTQLDSCPSKSVFVGDNYETDIVGAATVGCIPILLQRDQTKNPNFNGLIIRELKEILELLKFDKLSKY